MDERMLEIIKYFTLAAPPPDRLARWRTLLFYAYQQAPRCVVAGRFSGPYFDEPRSVENALSANMQNIPQKHKAIFLP
jgi:hypothetical protein